MDLLISKNVVKKDKVIIDIGNNQIKFLAIHYSGGKISVTGSYAADIVDEATTSEIAQYVSDCIFREKVIKRGEIILSIPSDLVQYRIDSAKNIKMSALDKYIHDNNKLGNQHTHIIDWTFLGEREENGDTLKYYMTAAVGRSSVTQFVEEFEKFGLNITEITFPTNNIVCLSDLYKNDFEHVNKLYINIDAQSSVVLVESGGTFIYSRIIDVIPYAVSEFQNEILRIIQMCENDGIDISKIICVGDSIPELFDDFVANNIAIDIINDNQWNEKAGDGYILSLTHSDVAGNFSPEIGACLAAVQRQKRINLVPAEYKERQTNKYMFCSFGVIAGIIAIIMAVTYINLGVTKYTLNKLRADDSEYNQKLAQIEMLERANKSGQDFIDQYERINFPFYNFMQFIQYNKPQGLTIISVDSVNKLMQGSEKSKTENSDQSEGEENSDQSEGEENPGESEGEKNSEETVEILEPTQNTISQYTKDLLGEKISIRGYSVDSSDISTFLYDLSKIPYVADLELKAIEENKIAGSDIILFEAVAILGRGKTLAISE